VRQLARHELLLESRRHPAVKLLRQIPAIGPIRAALLVALLQYRYVRGKLQRNRERITVRGLSDNYNKDLKNLFKGLPSLPALVLARSTTSMWLWWRKGCGRPWPVSPWHERLSPSL